MLIVFALLLTAWVPVSSEEGTVKLRRRLYGTDETIATTIPMDETTRAHTPDETTPVETVPTMEESAEKPEEKMYAIPESTRIQLGKA